MKRRLLLALCFLALPVTIWAVIWLCFAWDGT
jgi:hypothetical protein